MIEHHIYTDGSCPVAYGPGAWAYIVLGAEVNVYDSGYEPAPQTNNTMELTAVLMALRFVKQWKMRGEPIIIHADSTYVINGMISQFRHQVADGSIDPPNADIWKRLHKHAEACKNLKFVHVKGHSGDIWNEYADRMAAKALRDGTRAETESRRQQRIRRV
jgi:ribonuclease HI